VTDEPQSQSPAPSDEDRPEYSPSTSDKVAALVDQRPEIAAGGALAGGILFALILKRLGR